jgi:hypothetical protein
MTKTAEYHLNAAIDLRGRILARQSNETPVQAWAGVCRQCAFADAAKRMELASKPCHSFSDNRWFARLDRIWWTAKAQVETLGKAA